MGASFNTNATALQHPLMTGGVQPVFGNQNASDEEQEEQDDEGEEEEVEDNEGESENDVNLTNRKN